MNEGLCLDAGALIGVERGNRWLLLLLERVRAGGHAIEVPAGVLAQVWRGGSRQARLARFLNTDGVRVVDLHRQIALAVGELCGISGAADIVDVHVALHARRHGQTVVTSDPDDIAAIAPDLSIVVI